MDANIEKPKNCDDKENNTTGNEGGAEKSADTITDKAIKNNHDSKEGAAAEDGEAHLPKCPPPPILNLDKLSQEVDEYLATLAAPKEDDESIPQDVPNFVKQFSLMVEARVSDYDSGESLVKWGSLPDEDATSFLEAILRLSSLSISLSRFSSQPNFAGSVDRIGGVLERAISYVEEEFKALLEDYQFQDSDPNPNNQKEKREGYFPGYRDEVLSNLTRLSRMMIAMGYETECCEAYFVGRRNALEDSLHKLGFEKHSIDDVQKMEWEVLEREIVSWIVTFKYVVSVFSREQTLGKAVFADHPSIADHLLCSVARSLSATVLNFAGAVALTKSSLENLFQFLDMYEVLRDVVPTMDDLFPEEWVKEFKSENGIIRGRLGEAIVSIFSELETSIKSHSEKTLVPGGAIHLLTRYTMNFLKFVCEYKETLEQIFMDHLKTYGGSESQPPPPAEATPFEAQLMKIMELLDENLEAKSKLYNDHALGAIFLMNNGKYILQKVRGLNVMNILMGDAWFRKKSIDLRQYHKVYQRETWGKLLSCNCIQSFFRLHLIRYRSCPRPEPL